ncbi:MAG TPA: aminoacyl-tRNA hydrolase [Actinomycetaceae bacterium]|nr:aminoacyl-tRNA hydrolase [Actinomycetaceae bacterium]
MSETWIVMGLGNPGDRYARNRHNVGQMVVDVLAARAGARFQRHRSRAVVANVRVGTIAGGAPGPKVILAKSAGYMNESGRPLGALAKAEGVGPERILVVHDELDLPTGTLRLKIDGGEGGHKGLKSITSHLGTQEYARLRIGIGRPPGQMDPADYVLRDFRGKEGEEMAVVVVEAADAVEAVLTQGFSKAQMELHTV